MGWIFIVVTAALGLYMAWNIGANDLANSFGDAVGARAISVRKAVIAAAICEFAGSVLVGSHVAETIRSGIVDPQLIMQRPDLAAHEGAAVLALGMACALLGASIWLNVATVFGMPVSTTHSIVGGVAGFGIVAAGWHAVKWGKMGEIVASWFLSPVLGGLLAFIFFKLILWAILDRDRPIRAARRYAPVVVFLTATVVVLATVYKGLTNVIKDAPWLTGTVAFMMSIGCGLVAALVALVLMRRFLRDDDRLPLKEQIGRVEKVFAPLVIITSCSVAFAHGANDVANAIGPLAAVVDILQTGEVKTNVAVPFWILALGGGGIVLGLATFGYRVMGTIGQKLTQLTPSRGVAADLSCSITVLGASKLGLPISTTHVIVGAIIGVGLARGLSAVNKKVTGDIFGSWFITVPASAGVAIVLFLLGRAFLLDVIVGYM